MSDFLRADARMALARYESSVAAFGMEAGFPMKDVRIVQEYIDRLEAALNAITGIDMIMRPDEPSRIVKRMKDIARKALEGKDE